MKYVQMLLVVVALLVGRHALAMDDVVYFHPDPTGSATYAYSEDGDLCWSQLYAPFGEKIEPNDLFPAQGCGMLGSERGFTGHLQDASGLVYMKQRYYDPSIMRFLSVDPVEIDYSEPQSYNRYSYAFNNPYKYTDPTGEVPFLIPVLVFLAKEVAAEIASRATGGATDFLSARRSFKKGISYAANRAGSESLKNASGNLDDAARLARTQPHGSFTRIEFGRNVDQNRHAFRHIEAFGVDVKDARVAITRDITQNADKLRNGINNRVVNVNGVNLRFSVFRFDDGRINVGRITPPR